MAGFATLDDLQAAQQLHATAYVIKVDSELPDDWGACWPATVIPATTPGTAYTDDATAITFQALSGRRKVLVGVACHNLTNTNAYILRLVDRLVGVSAIVVNSTGDKTINSTALPTRATGGDDVQVYVEVTVIGATTAPIMSLSSYTNQSGAATRAGASFTFSSLTSDVGTVFGPLPLQAGDSGVRSVETINVSVAAGGSCQMDVWLLRSIVDISTGPDVGTSAEQIPNHKVMPIPFMQLQRIHDGASIVGLAKGDAGLENYMVTLDVAIDS